MATKINPATIITDIRVAMKEMSRTAAAADDAKTTSGWRAAAHARHKAACTHTDLTKAAVHLFRLMNGWDTKPDPRSFRLRDIGRRSGNFPQNINTDLFDHCIWTRGSGRCAAIIAQPYEHAEDGRAERLAAEHGVACHVPAHPFASFHYPGWTKFYVFTSPDHSIQWLPEQVNGFADPTVFAPSASTLGAPAGRKSA